MSPALDKISRDLRSAVLGAEHGRALQLSRDYTAALRELWEAMPEKERSASPLPKQARELLHWARGMTVIQRSMAAAQLMVVEKARLYNAARSSGPSSIVQTRG